MLYSVFTQCITEWPPRSLIMVRKKWLSHLIYYRPCIERTQACFCCIDNFAKKSARDITDNPQLTCAPTPMPGKYHVSLIQRTPLLARRLFFCPSCSQIRHLSFSSGPAPTARSTIKRSASTLSGSSIVSATKNIPERFQELYKALEELKNTPGNHVNLGRLELAQRGIETENPLIRIAGA